MSQDLKFIYPFSFSSSHVTVTVEKKKPIDKGFQAP